MDYTTVSLRFGALDYTTAEDRGSSREARPRAANILARNGQQQVWEDLLATTRSTCQLYVTDLKSAKTSTANEPDWQQRQVAAATPVTAKDISFRSDQLIGTEVRNSHNTALGSVDDIVTSLQTRKFAYLVIARGGIFGFDQNYVPVPWEDFKVTPNASLLVLDTTKSVMEAGPRWVMTNSPPQANSISSARKWTRTGKRICRAMVPAESTVDRNPAQYRRNTRS